ncbi:MAG: GlsB/YeaQ/YmgE family stress response membrane protein [Saprospiraceae bacterium]
MDIVIMLVFGAIAGWLGNLIFTDHGLGLYGNIIAGLLGSVFGFWLLGEFGIHIGEGYLNTLATGLCGALTILFLVNLILPGRNSQ